MGPLAPESRKRGQNFLYVAYQGKKKRWWELIGKGGSTLVTLSITELGGPKVELWDFSGKLECKYFV